MNGEIQVVIGAGGGGKVEDVIEVSLDIDELNDFVVKRLRDINGVESTSTLVVLKDIE